MRYTNNQNNGYAGLDDVKPDRLLVSVYRIYSKLNKHQIIRLLLQCNFLKILVVNFLALLLVCSALPAFGATAEKYPDLGLYVGEEAPPPRSPRPTSKIAENLTVITSDDIVRINAHTLADVLQTVPGIQLDVVRTPGSAVFFNIHGASSPQVQVLIDDVPWNYFNLNVTEPGMVPVQQIDRIEIIKGAASAAWGPALGGVVNIITKTPEPERKLAGMVSGSIGERFTADSRGELSGTLDRFGYYLSAGNLHSDGHLTNNGSNNNSAFAKLNYNLPTQGSLTVGATLLGAHRGDLDSYLAIWDVTARQNDERTTSSFYLKFAQPVSELLRLDLLGFTTCRDVSNSLLLHSSLGTVVRQNDYQVRETSHGISARLTWGDSQYNIITGVDFENGSSRSWDKLSPGPSLFDRTWDKWATYGNGTISFGQLTILPGIRFDHTGLSGDYLSYTLGATYSVTDRTVLRTYAAQGYGLTNPQFRHGLQKTRTVQSGVETGAVPYIWLKGTFFYNWLDNIEYVNDGTLHNQIKQGFEIEARTVPLYGVSLSSGYTYLYASDRDTGKQLQSDPGQSLPPQSLKLGVQYDNNDLGLRGTLFGNYVRWNANAESNARDKAMIWDLHLGWRLFPKQELSPELFFSARNLFNGIQSSNNELYPNAPRWFEGGVRFKF